MAGRRDAMLKVPEQQLCKEDRATARGE